MRATPYHLDLARHCFAIAGGVLPGLAPAMDDSFAPVSQLMQIYQDIYELDPWPAIIMQPHMFDLYEGNTSVYYSLQYPTAVRLAVKATARDSVINDIFHLGLLINKYSQALQMQDYQIHATSLGVIPDRVAFRYYHSSVPELGAVTLCTDIPNHDPNFKSLSQGNFPRNSRFFTGCVQIQPRCHVSGDT